MTFDLYQALKPALFQLMPETAHNLAFGAGKVAQQIPGLPQLLGATCGSPAPTLARTVCGLTFPTPIGLAAGLDKGAELLPLWKAMGFGHVEIGTVTPRPQPGNPKPRCFRLPEEELILNRMGFNSEGMEAVAARLKHRPSGLLVGGNLGKNKVTPEEEALDDYRTAFRTLAPLVDYVAINISSPNTPGLRNLQAAELLRPLLDGLMATRKEMGLERQPLFVKLAPDMEPEALDATVDVIAQSGLSGIIATNTTLDRGIVSQANRERVESWGAGGLSGKALRPKARAVQQRILARLPQGMTLIACGGIHTAGHVRESLEDGAGLVQIYSGFIFGGPWMIGRINGELARG